jgi:hypothetical protein
MLSTDDMHAPFVGSFIVRDSRGRVLERVASEIVRYSPEMTDADPAWLERRDPDLERIRVNKFAANN